MAETLQGLLEGYKVTILSTLASLNGIDLRGEKQNKSNLVRLLTNHFSRAQFISQAFQDLMPVEREAVNTLLHQGGQTTAFNLERRLIALRLVERASGKEIASHSDRRPDLHGLPPRSLEEVMARLLARGLVFAPVYRDPYGQPVLLDFARAPEYVIPEAIRRHLPKPPALSAWTPPEMGVPERIQAGSARVFQRDLYLYWSFVHANPVELIAKGLLPKRALMALNDTLLVKETIGTGQGESDFPRLVFMRQILSGLGLIWEKGGVLLAIADPSFFGLGPVDRIQNGFTEYLNGKGVDELAWHPGVQIYSGGAPALPTPAAVQDARYAILVFCKRAINWTSLPDLLERVRETAYEFLFKRTPTMIYSTFHGTYHPVSNPYFNSTNPLGWNFPNIKDEESGWDQVEAGFIRRVLQGPLHWMGLVDLGWTRPDLKEPDAFRLTPVGAWLLGSGPVPEINVSGGRVILQPDFHITAFEPISDQILINLERFAQRLTADRAIEFRLTQVSVYNAQQQGWNGSRIQAYLEELTGMPVPANIQRSLEDWQALHERIVIYPHVSLVHAASPSDLDILEQDPGLYSLLADRPAPVLVRLADRKNIQILSQQLTGQGWLALVSLGGKKLPTNSVEIFSDGRLSFTVPTPDLYLHGHLARFAEPDGAGDSRGYRLTPGSIQRAARNGMSAPQVVSEIRRVLRGDFPQVLEQRLRAWAGHYGEIAMEETVLLRIKSAETLKELLADPEIGPLLHPLEASEVPVTARARTKDLARLRRILEERGIPYKEPH